MPRIINRKQQIKGFFALAFGFMVIFSFLAGLIYWNYVNSIYSNTDKALTSLGVELEQLGKVENNVPVDSEFKKHPIPNATDGYRLNFIYFDDNNKQIIVPNGDVAPDGQIGRPRIKVDFNTSFLGNGPFNVKTGHGFIRVLAIKYKKSINVIDYNGKLHHAKKAYAFIDATDTVINLRHFQELIAWSFGFAFLISLLFAYFISRMNMRPILKAWQQQQDFVNNAAHELRTPMSVIQGKLETMLTKPSSTVRDESEAIILSLSEVRRLSSLTDNMLTLAKTGSNMTKIVKEETDIAAYLQKIIAPYEEMAEFDEKSVDLDVEVNRPVPVDRKRIHQLMVLLLDNALKYSDAGASVKVTARTEKNRLVLTVADTGRGISNAAKKHVFDRFYREDKTGNRETGGTGLGLSIAEWIVLAHGGKITVADNQPRGTIFKVVLPI
ncbi:sensor histidine kinase [Eupransor demetentiae]|uniref:histidine kinase n=1 Tax=Eupransor demetentiae TaxID=3109584 RepID=A0ABP0EQK6_9LACO|nr:K+-sensing histidine kinase KdpD (KdpD) [Lactobacillaceae bacterium LMG 33000]